MSESILRQPGKTHYRTIFLSDVHLGTRGCQAERLIDFLKGHTCERLYLVGDIIDGWRMRSGVYWPQQHSNVVRRFLTLAKRGTKIVYVSGNHDEFLRKYSDLTIGNLELVDQAVHVSAAGERLLVVHGDEYDVVTRYHRWVAFLGDQGYTVLLQLNRHFNALRSRLGYGYWSLAAWIKHRVKRAVSFISEYEEALVHQCRKQGYDGVICGHIHHAEIRELDGIGYMNCGDWVESCTALVEDSAGNFRILDWSGGAGQPAGIVPLADPRTVADAVPRRASA